MTITHGGAAGKPQPQPADLSEGPTFGLGRIAVEELTG